MLLLPDLSTGVLRSLIQSLMFFSVKSAPFCLKDAFAFWALCCNNFLASSILDHGNFLIFSLDVSIPLTGGKINVQHILFIVVNLTPLAKLHCVILRFISEVQHVFVLVFMMMYFSKLNNEDLDFHSNHVSFNNFVLNAAARAGNSPVSDCKKSDYTKNLQPNQMIFLEKTKRFWRIIKFSSHIC